MWRRGTTLIIFIEYSFYNPRLEGFNIVVNFVANILDNSETKYLNIEYSQTLFRTGYKLVEYNKSGGKLHLAYFGMEKQELKSD